MALLALGACSSGGGGGDEPPAPPPAAASCTNDVANFQGVCSGFADSANIDWQAGGDGSGGVGDGGASGDGGVGAGGDFGQFRNVTIKAYRSVNGNWVELGSALTDGVKGMVTIRPGRTYTGPLLVELTGGANAEYFEEGRNAFVPFPAGRVIRVVVPRIDRNIGITPFTEAAYQMLTSGSADESANTPTPTPAQILAANARVAVLLNEHFPAALEVRNITRLPFIKSASVAQGSLGLNDRGVYGVVNGAFSKQAAAFNTASATPTLDAVAQLAEDLRDGKLDGFNGNRPAATAERRTYDPQTLTSELTAALAHQAERFGAPALRDTLPKLVNFGGTRYEGYLFDSHVSRNRGAVSTVAGWLAGNTLNLSVGQANPKALPQGQSAHSMIGNMGHGGAFFKIDSTDTTANPVYRVYALGDNVNGELGTGNTTSTSRQLVEVQLPGPMTHAAGGFAHTLFRLGDGTVYAVGDNTFGQLGTDPATLPRSVTPVPVALPAIAGGAVAVAATSVASYALMADGSVYAWGSNGGFGLLGDGRASGMVSTPAVVTGLTEVVQLSARDNDVVALRRDQSIVQWGSHPADPGGAYTDGDVTTPYRGGTFMPTTVTGLPTFTVNGSTRPVPVRKIITEQGLFGALLANGHVYTWGVHFDLSAKTILRDLNAARVLGMPPLRDMMPGGFVGYGARPFDRLTAMGVDYAGGMWKIRGRVAERFDPDNPTIQRRPQTGVPRSANCASCHTFLDESLERLRERQAAEAPIPGTAAICAPPAVHFATNGISLIRAETECIQCHNPARLDPRYANQLTPAFATNGGWPNCQKPTNLPPRDNVPATPITNACTIPVGHVFTPPGTVCASCHNSVAARALQDLTPPCAQPGSGELPTLALTAVISGATNGGGAVLTNGGYSRDGTVRLQGTLSAPLAGSQTLQVLRNGTPVGNAVASGAAWSFSEAALASGTTASYTVRAVEGAGFGAPSAPFVVRVDYAAPAVTAAVTTITDDVWGPIADGNFTTDTTPTVSGTLVGTLDSGDVVQVLRNGLIEGNATVSGNSWSFTEPAPLGQGGHFFQARVVDTAGNASALGLGRSVTLIGGLATAGITAVADNQGVPVAAGSITSRNTLVLSGTMSSPLIPGQVVRVLRNGVLVDSAPYPPGGQTWSFTDSAPEGLSSYTVRVDGGAVQGSVSSAWAVTVDSIAPAQTVVITQLSDDFIGPLADGATTADQTPSLTGTLNPPLGAGETLLVRRTNMGTGAVVQATLTPGGTNWGFTETSLVPAGTYSYVAYVFDQAANTSAVAAARIVTIDPTAIPLPGAAATINTINGVTPTGSPAVIPPSNVNTPVLAGTIQRALQTGEVVKIHRNNGTGAAPVGNAAINVGQTSWTFVNSILADGSYTYTAQVQLASNSAVFGQMSASVGGTVDTTVPTQTHSNNAVSDLNLVPVTNGNTASTAVMVTGNISAALGPTETLQVVRTGGAGTVVRNPVPAASFPFGWTLNETGLVAGNTYTYTVRVVDAAGNQGPSTAFNVTVIAPLPTISSFAVSGVSNGFVATTTPTVTGSISAALPGTPAPGALVRVYRNGTPAGTASIVNTTFFTFTDSARADGSSITYTARVENGSAYSTASSGVAVTIDVTPPAAPTISSVQANDRPFENATTGEASAPFGRISGAVNIAANATTGEVDPVISVSFAALGVNERIRIYRNGLQIGGDFTTAGGTSFTIEDSPRLNRPAAFVNPTNTTGVDITYTARRVDPAGNLSTIGAGSSFSLTVNYLNCNQARALSRQDATANPTHGANWTTTGAATCRGCHVGPANTPTATGLIPAPGAGAGGSFQYYWCRKTE